MGRTKNENDAQGRRDNKEVIFSLGPAYIDDMRGNL